MTMHIEGSVWEQEMYNHLIAHASAEGEVLNEYQRLADDEELSPAFRYLARLILEDEARHHRTFMDLAEAMRQMGEIRDEEVPIPRLRRMRMDRARVLEPTKRMLEVEQADAKALKDLAKDFKDVRDTTLYALLIDLMRDDTEKHIRILRFIRDHA
jgi:hypothetical protein